MGIVVNISREENNNKQNHITIAKERNKEKSVK